MNDCLQNTDQKAKTHERDNENHIHRSLFISPLENQVRVMRYGRPSGLMWKNLLNLHLETHVLHTMKATNIYIYG